MKHEVLFALAGIVGLGLLCQWVASRVRIPTILLLLGAGVVAGPVLGVLEPDRLFGDLLSPGVSLGVAVILFEGGLGLKVRDLQGVRAALIRLLTIGMVITWAGVAAAAYFCLGFDWRIAVLLGAILTVTGPTVVGPLLRHVRLGGRVGALLRWEGIAIDPVGAVLAALVFQALRGADAGEIIGELFLTGLVGIACGAIAAGGIVLIVKNYWAPDRLHGPLVLALVLCVFAIADGIQPESGVVAVTVMGVVLANQRSVSIRHVIEFKEALTVLLLSSLFIVLGARVQPSGLTALGWGGLLFLACVIFVIRPLAVLASTSGGALSWREKAFMAWMAPRGIVAAAVASVFALQLVSAGLGGANVLVPATFLVIFGTAAIYGLTAPLLARKLGLVHPDPQGVLFVGAHAWARELATALRESGCDVCLADTDRSNVTAARLAGLPAFYGSILSEHAEEEIDTSGISRLVALTSNDELNALACQHFAEEFGREEVYHLPFKATDGRHESVSVDRRGRELLADGETFDMVIARVGSNPIVKSTKLTEQFDFESYRQMHAGSAIPVFVLSGTGRVTPIVAGQANRPKPGDTIIALMPRKASDS